ncbi:hypothetical protein HY632_05340 [Candidatus Uhrbacteria bacterium]|nr:hypothetical protein [Candidatus Uhrbacteria bacterium]
MSRYQWAWFGTYIIAPFIALSGVLADVSIIMIARQQSSALESFLTLVVGMVVSTAIVAFGIHGIAQGRRDLAGDHWRSEDFE